MENVNIFDDLVEEEEIVVKPKKEQPLSNKDWAAKFKAGLSVEEQMENLLVKINPKCFKGTLTAKNPTNIA